MTKDDEVKLFERHLLTEELNSVNESIQYVVSLVENSSNKEALVDTIVTPPWVPTAQPVDLSVEITKEKEVPCFSFNYMQVKILWLQTLVDKGYKLKTVHLDSKLPFLEAERFLISN